MCSSPESQSSPEPIAIVGTGFRFPGGASTPSKLWDLLHSPRDVLAPIPQSRFNAEGFYHQDGEYGGHSNVRDSYTIAEDVAAWDAGFFNVAAAEASAIDPQQRLLTECVYEALESGGHSVQALRGSDTAVYVGLVNEEYSDIHYRELNTTPRYFSTGTGRSIASNRISYIFDWRGASMTIDTACSSSLVAIHQAVQTLRSGASKVAVAAGVNMLLGPEPYIVESSFHMLSPTGRCRMWDASADGYGRGDGVAAVILKTLSQAIADGDRIESVIRETGINQDGATGGITVPNASAQIALIRDTYRRAGLDLAKRSDRPQFFECHGTGTPTGDPLEARAVHEALGKHIVVDESPGRPPLYVGSIKTVIGHTEATAGIAGIIKASLALQNGLIPPNLLFERLNPAIEPLYHGLQVPVGKPVPWPATGASPRRASNSHAILESYQLPQAQGTKCAQESVPLPFVFSAATKASLKRMLALFGDFLSPQQRPQDLTAHDLAFTLNSRRSALSCRAVFAARGLEDLANKIRDTISDPDWQPTATAPEGKNVGSRAPRILGVFAGQGAQWPGMARQIIGDIPFVQQRVVELEGHLQDLASQDAPSWSLRDELGKVQGSNLDLAQFSQPLCTALQIIQVDLLAAAGIRFSAVVGHSSGEIAAAYAAGLLSARDAMAVAYYRGLHSPRLVGKSKNSKGGSMMAAGISYAEALAVVGLEQFQGRIAVAAHNSPASVTLSGDEDAILEAKELLTSEGKFARLLRVDQAYHSHHMRPCLAPYVASLQRAGVGAVRPTPRSNQETIWYSSVHRGGAGQRVMTAVDCEYWAANMAQTVLFAGAVESAVTADASAAAQPFTTAIGLGPHGALRGPLEDILGSLSRTQGGNSTAERTQIPYTDVLTRNQDDSLCLMRCVGTLLANGAVKSADVGRFQSTVYQLEQLGGRRLIPARNLPSYPWDHSRTFWHESRRSRALRTRSKPANPLLGTLSPDSSATDLAWHNLVRLADLPWLRGHRLQGQVVYPAAAYMAGAIDAALHVAGEMGREVRAIEFRHVWIGKAIAFDDDSASGGVEVYTTLTINDDRVDEKAVLDARFRVRSSVFGSASTDAAMNFSGSMLITMLDPGGQARPLLLPQKQPPALLVQVGHEGFYQELDQIGYQYTDSFRTLTSARRKLGYAQSSLQLPLPGLLHRSEKDFLLHPGPLDALFQAILLAYSSPGDGRLWSLHVPIAVDRMLIDVDKVRASNSTSAYSIEASITQDPSFSGQPQKGIGGDVGIVTSDGSAGLVRAEGVRLAPLAMAAADDDVDMFLEPVEGGISTDCAASMFLPDNKTIARATEEETRFGWLLERIAHFYLGRLAEEITPEQEAKAQWHHQKLIKYARRVSREVAAGRQPYVKVEHAQDTYEIITDLMDRHAHVIDVQLMRAVGENLGAAVRGETVILQHMMHDGMLNRSYEETLGVKPFSEFLSRVIEQITFVHPEASILEIGAGTGGATKRILKRIPDRFGHYTFTDISSGFFEKAKSVFSSFAESGRMSFRALDIERDPVREQGFQEHSYDVVLASFVLHATADLENTLRNCRRLLRPGGYLVLLEMTSNDTLRLGLTMGGLEGWWLGADAGRPWSPCVGFDEWHRLLELTGFTGIEDQTPQLDLLAWPYGILVSRAVNSDVRMLLEPCKEALLTRDSLARMPNLLIVAGSSAKNVALADELREMLRPFSASQVVVNGGFGGFVRGQTQRRQSCLHEGAQEKDLTVLYLADLDQQPLLQDISQDAFQGLKELLRLSPKHLLWLTHGARDGQRPYAVASIGLGRALIMEYRQVAMQFIDFATASPDAGEVSDHLLRLVVQSAFKKQGTNLLHSQEPEIAVDEHGRVLVSRIQPHRHFNHAYNSARRVVSEPADPAGHYEVYDEWDEDGAELVARILLPRPQGLTHSSSVGYAAARGIKPLYSVPLALRPGGRTWNLSAGFPVPPVSAETGAQRSVQIILSDRVGSVITALSKPMSVSAGANLPALLGDMAALILASLITSEAERDCQPIKHGYEPRSQGVFLVLEPHVALARLLFTKAAASASWTIICVTTSPEKAALAPENFAFFDANASRPAIRQALRLSGFAKVLGIVICCDPAARNSDAQPLARALRGSLPELARARTTLVADLVRDAHVSRPVPEIKSGPASQSLLISIFHDAVINAQKITPSRSDESVHFVSPQEYVQRSAKSTPNGLSVIDWSAAWRSPLTTTARPLDGVEPLLRGDRTYLLLGLGGKGGLGSSLAEYMVGQGARHIVLTSRNPGVQSELVASYARRGVRIEGVANDITDKTALEKLVKDLQESPDWPPIAGVANGAMVLADVSLDNMTHDQMVRVLRPKVVGSTLLDQIFESAPLDFFMLVSSLSCVLGNRGQANYDAANMFLVGLAKQRRARGLTASVVDIGAVMGTGYMAREVKEQTLRQMVGAGFSKMSERDFCMAFAHGILAGRPGLAYGGSSSSSEVITGLNVPPPTAEFQPDWVTNPRFSHMIAKSRAIASRKAQDPVSETKAEKTRDLLKRSRTPGELSRVVSAAMFKKMVYMLQVGQEVAGDVDAFSRRSTSSLGVDSLVAVELRTWVFREFGVDIPVFKILADTNLADMVGFILAALPAKLTPSLDKDSNQDSVPGSALEEPNQQQQQQQQQPTKVTRRNWPELVKDRIVVV
ncbi:Type I Iterative PKS [Pyricularia oryzae]|nr:Type I Iterative PKS [Pyricularia oryzae]